MGNCGGGGGGESEEGSSAVVRRDGIVNGLIEVKARKGVKKMK